MAPASRILIGTESKPRWGQNNVPCPFLHLTRMWTYGKRAKRFFLKYQKLPYNANDEPEPVKVTGSFGLPSSSMTSGNAPAKPKPGGLFASSSDDSSSSESGSSSGSGSGSNSDAGDADGDGASQSESE
jgi:hypothetical protein